MRILAIETSGQRGSVAILTGEADITQTVGLTMLTAERRTAQALAPALESLLAGAEWTPDSVNLVAVAVGPGSFTGLRIGVTTAKTFAYAVGAEIVGVNTLDVLAQQVSTTAAPLWAIVDAYRGELFAARFHGVDGADMKTSILTQNTWLAALRPGDNVTGPALRRIRSRLPDEVRVVPESQWQPTAEAVGQVGWQAYTSGRRDDLWQLVPHYYRQSAAEERLS
jgi:tRNA threonylcarbamoyladenosine biosynthesis protein TsaB